MLRHLRHYPSITAGQAGFMTATEDLLAAIGPAADFAGAPCVGRWAWFDPPNDHEPTASVQSRHEAAIHVCGTCPLPTMAHCAATVRALPKRHQPGDRLTTDQGRESHGHAATVPCKADPWRASESIPRSDPTSASAVGRAHPSRPTAPPNRSTRLDPGDRKPR